MSSGSFHQIMVMVKVKNGQLPLQVQHPFENEDGKESSHQTKRYKLNPAIFAFLKNIFEETYGIGLTRDVFSSGQDSLTKHGFPAKLQGRETYFIHAPYKEL